MAAVVSARTVGQAVADHLENNVPHATGYYGQVGRRLDGSTDEDPPTKGQYDPRVKPYFTLYPGVGEGVGDDYDLARCDPLLVWSCQVTAVAGDVADLEALVDRLAGALDGWRPSVSPYAASPLRPPFGYQAGTFRTDDTVSPPRLWLPLQYRTTLTGTN